MHRLQTCCGCCDLKTGAIIIGICGIMFTISGIITHSVGLETIEDETTKNQVTLLIIYSYVYLFVDAMLIYGAVKESKYFLLPWIACVGFGLGFITLFCIIFMFFEPILIIGTIISVSFWYVWYCVVSFYNQINQPWSTIVTVGGYPEAQQPNTVMMIQQQPSLVSYEAHQPPAYLNSEFVKTPENV